MTENAQFRPQLLIKLCSGCIIILFSIATHNNEEEEEFRDFYHSDIHTHSRHPNLFHEGREREEDNKQHFGRRFQIFRVIVTSFIYILVIYKKKLTGGLERINSVSHLLIISNVSL